MTRRLTFALAGLCVLATAAPADEAPVTKWAIRVAKILTMEGDPIVDGVILVADGKIEKLGPARDVAIPKGYRRFDGGDAWAVPGFVDLHTHTGGSDINDMIYQVNPDLTAADNLAPNNPRLVMARHCGVTTVLFIPGSGTNMGGFGVLMKTTGSTPATALVRSPGALKIAQAGNPERRGGELGSSRVGMTHLIRETVREGLEYGRAWAAFERGETKEKPKYDDRWELFRGIAKKEIPIIVHTQWVQVIQTTVRVLHDEFDVRCVLSHATFESYRIAPLVARRGIGVNAGPRNVYFDRRDGRLHGIAAEWWKGGVRNLSINTDSPVVAGRDLVTQATVAVRFGLPEDAALRALTIMPARQVLIDEQVGSFKPGKVADIVLHSGPPLDPRTRVEAVFIRGTLVDDLRDDGADR